MKDGLTRDTQGKRTEKTHVRDLTFNDWHRKFLSNRCYATDIDFYEYRIENGKIVPKAILEVKQAHVRQKKYLCSANTRALLTLAHRANIRFMIILYLRREEESLECKFWVWEPHNIEELERYREQNFDKFFKVYSNLELAKLLEEL